MSSIPAIVLAADLGGTTFKAALVASSGEVVAQVSLPAPAPDGRGLIAPDGWWRAFRDAATALRRDDASAFAAVAAIAITGVTRTPVVLGRDGNALCSAITARDARAQEIAQDIASRAGLDPQTCPEVAHYDAF